MPEIFEKICELKVEAVPSSILKKIHRRILILKFRPLIYSLALIFSSSFVLLSSHIYRSLVETEAMSIIKVIINDFELSFDYFNNSFVSLNEVMPKNDIILLLVNSLIILSFIELFRRYHKELLKINN